MTASSKASLKRCLTTGVALAICYALLLAIYFPFGSRALAAGASAGADYSSQEVQYQLQDEILLTLEASLPGEDYIIEDLQTCYLSKEYLEELEFNSKPNIYFGYTLEELDERFEGQRYVFTLGADGTTVVKAFTGYDNSYERIVGNLAVGTGVLLISATATVVTAAAGITPVSMTLAVATEKGVAGALSGAAIGGIIGAVMEGVATGDPDGTLLAAAVEASEGYKIGAVAGVLLSPVVNSGALPMDGTIQILRQINPGIGGRTFSVLEVGGISLGKTGASTARGLKFEQVAAAALDKKLGVTGARQQSYLGGKPVSYGGPGTTRPDYVATSADNVITAYEFKSCDITLKSALPQQIAILKKEIGARVTHLPAGSKQEIILDGRSGNLARISDKDFNDACTAIRAALDDIYPNIPITVIR